MLVRLNYFELMQGATAGANRQVYALSKGLKDRFQTTPARAWGIHIEGACSELAVAKALNICHTLHKTGPGDLRINGQTIEVRSTHHTNGKLILRPSDDLSSLYVLAIGRAPVYRIAGFIEGKEVATPEFWNDPDDDRPGAWFIPQKALRPIQELAQLAF